MSVLSLDTDTAIAEAIDQSIRETFDMMIEQELHHVQTSCLANAQPRPTTPGTVEEEITVVVGLSGGLQGSVSVCLSKPAACLWTNKLIQHEAENLDQTVVDAIGELGNMVVGGAKGRLEDFSLTLGLPCVMLAGPSRLAFPSNCDPIHLEYTVEGHGISVFIALIHTNG